MALPALLRHRNRWRYVAAFLLVLAIGLWIFRKAIFDHPVTRAKMEVFDALKDGDLDRAQEVTIRAMDSMGMPVPASILPDSALTATDTLPIPAGSTTNR